MSGSSFRCRRGRYLAPAAGFHVAAATARVVLQLPPRGVEGAAQGDRDIVVLRLAVHDDLAVRHREPDPDLVETPLPVVPVGRLDPDLAPLNVVVVAVEPKGPAADLLLEPGALRNPPEVDRGFTFHDPSLVRRFPGRGNSDASIVRHLHARRACG